MLLSRYGRRKQTNFHGIVSWFTLDFSEISLTKNDLVGLSRHKLSTHKNKLERYLPCSSQPKIATTQYKMAAEKLETLITRLETVTGRLESVATRGGSGGGSAGVGGKRNKFFKLFQEEIGSGLEVSKIKITAFFLQFR